MGENISAIKVRKVPTWQVWEKRYQVRIDYVLAGRVEGKEREEVSCICGIIILIIVNK